MQEEAGVEDDGIDSLGSTRLEKLLPNCNVDKKNFVAYSFNESVTQIILVGQMERVVLTKY